MLLINNNNRKHNKKLSIKFQQGDLSFYFSDSFNNESRSFEENKIQSMPPQNFSLIDDSGNMRNISWPKLSHWQSYHFFDNQKMPFYFLQMTNERTNRHYQIIIRVETSRIGFFQKGIIQQWILNTDEDSLIDQQELIKQLLSFCRLHTNLMSVRIQPYMPGIDSLEATHQLLSQFGFIEVDPLSNTKTRMIDLRPSVEDILSSFSANGRARLKIKTKDQEVAEVKEINTVATIPFLQDALNASFKRSIKKECPYDFLPLFRRATQFANEVIMLGFFFKDTTSGPKAFITGISHGPIVEYSVGGSLSDSRLRQFPFNHILMWQLALRSKLSGSELLDMGGITNGTKEDALTGITNFKRFFPGFELSTGQEMEINLRPQYIYFYSLLQKIMRTISHLPKTERENVTKN